MNDDALFIFSVFVTKIVNVFVKFLLLFLSFNATKLFKPVSKKAVVFWLVFLGNNKL
jgi:hypothetical protein